MTEAPTSGAIMTDPAQQNKTTSPNGPVGSGPVLPRIAISFCTQCKWMLRAAYFGQELLSTFGTAVGEVALIPATGGLFKVELTYSPQTRDGESVGSTVRNVLLWDRKAEGGFPETKVLKQLVRDHIEPSKDLGHSDKHGKGSVKSKDPMLSPESASPNDATPKLEPSSDVRRNPDGTFCEDCK